MSLFVTTIRSSIKPPLYRVVSLVFCLLALAQAQSASLRPLPSSPWGWPQFQGETDENQFVEIQVSLDLKTWTPFSTAAHSSFAFQYPLLDGESARFFRFYSRPIPPRLFQKNLIQLEELIPQVGYLTEPFQNQRRFFSTEQPSWIKCFIFPEEPDRILFQKSDEFPFHYDFARQHLAPFKGLSRAEFDALSLFPGPNQKVVLGSVLFAPTSIPEVGFQLVGQTPYPLDQIIHYFRLAAASISSRFGFTAYYMPTLEQKPFALAHLQELTEAGIPLASPDRWFPGDGVYSEGWALGTLKYFSSAEIDTAFAEGRLQPQDILLIDAVPSDLPPVAGIVSLAPSTPNSHVALLAQSLHIPFVYLRNPTQQTDVLSWAGLTVYLSVSGEFFINQTSPFQTTIFPLDPAAPEFLIAAIQNEKTLPELDYPPKERLGAYFSSVEGFTESDTRYFGGKAAHFGRLRRVLPQQSPVAFAFSFDLWEDFLRQPFYLDSNLTLEQAIQNRLQNYSWPVPSISSLENDLVEIQNWIRQSPFPAPLESMILQALEVFPDNQKIRFRSSTNVEDTDQFIGAGLYDSFSGCLQDDLDNNTSGPSHCDPLEDQERGVLRAIRKVYASFYNLNAVLERLKYRVDESEVGMGLLVQLSFPDEIELANGVATVTKNSFGGHTTQLVSQVGAHSVTNPDGSELPEVVEVSEFNNSLFLRQQQPSSRVLLGDTVMDWESDYRNLTQMLLEVTRNYTRDHPKLTTFTLDYEFKKTKDQGLAVKQVRRLPPPPELPSIPPYILNTSTPMALFQGEWGDVFSKHRLKSIWWLETTNGVFNPQSGDLYTHLKWEYLENNRPVQLSRPIHLLDEYRHQVEGSQTIIDSWSQDFMGQKVTFELRTENVPASVDPLKSVASILSQWNLYLVARYSEPVFTITFNGPEFVKEETITLGQNTLLTPPSNRDLLQTRTMKSQDGKVTIQSQFFWPPPPTGATAGYTAPLHRWVQTTITGITPAPILLTDFYSQTYHPFHHNFAETFLFDPKLDPGVSPEHLEQLEAANIHLILCEWGGLEENQVKFIDSQNRLRDRL